MDAFAFDKIINWQAVNEDLAKGKDSQLLKLAKEIKTRKGKKEETK